MLETKIEALTEAVIKLTQAIEAQSKPTKVKEKKEQEPAVATPIAPQPTVDTPIVIPPSEPAAASAIPTREEVHALCLELVRKDPANKEKIKSVLSHFKSKLIKDVPDSEFESFASCIVELKDE